MSLEIISSILISLIIIQSKFATSCNCNTTILHIHCNTINGQFYKSHCFYLSTNLTDNFGTAVQTCVQEGKNFAIRFGMSNVVGGIAKFITRTAYDAVVSNTSLIPATTVVRIGLREIGFGSKNYKAFFWVHNNVWQNVADLTWKMDNGFSADDDFSADLNGGNAVYLYGTTDANTFYVQNFKTTPSYANNVSSACSNDLYADDVCGDNITSNSITNQFPYSNATCEERCVYSGGLSYNRKCLFHSIVKSEWFASIYLCQYVAVLFGIGTPGKLVNFVDQNELVNISTSFMVKANRSDTIPAWIGMRSECPSTNNLLEFSWIGSQNATISAVDSSINSNLQLIPDNSCVRLDSGNAVKNDYCNQSNFFICEFLLCTQTENIIPAPMCIEKSTMISTTSTTILTTTLSATVGESTIGQIGIQEETTIEPAIMSTKSETTESPTTSQGITTTSVLSSTTIEISSSSVSNQQNSSRITDSRALTTSKDIPTSSNPVEIFQQNRSFSTNSGRITTFLSQDVTNANDHNCLYGEWTEFSTCNNKKMKERSKKSRTAIANCNRTIVESAECSLDDLNPMSPAEKKAAKVLQSLGCSWLIAACSACLLFSILFRHLTVEWTIHFLQELSLLLMHVLIVIGQDQRKNLTLCTFSSAGIQFFTTSLFSLFALETLEIYGIITAVVIDRSFVTFANIAVVGIGIPFAITSFTLMIQYKNMISQFSCWLNLGQPLAFATFIPVISCSCLSAVLLEATGQWNMATVYMKNSGQILTAKLNQRSLLVLLPLQVSAWFVGQWAIYYQNIAMFSTVFGLNLALGIAMFFFHIMSNEKGRNCVKYLLAKIRKT